MVVVGFPIYLGVLIIFSMCISATMARAGRAIAYSLSFLVLFTLGTYIVGMMLLAAGESGSSLAWAGETIRGFNPIVLINDVVDAGTLYRFAPFRQFTIPQPTEAALWAFATNVGTALCGLVALALLLRGRFQHWVRKHV